MVSFTAEQRFIVTGASSGIGEGVALLLNELGATVIGIGRNQERLEGMKAKAKHPQKCLSGAKGPCRRYLKVASIRQVAEG